MIISPARSAERGLTSTVTFARGNLALHGSVVKSTASDPNAKDSGGVYRLEESARTFVREHDSVRAIKNEYRQWYYAPGQAGLRAAARSALTGRDLMCPCPVGEPCHGEVLLTDVNRADRWCGRG